MQDEYDYDLLCELAYQSWLDRGQAMNPGKADKDVANSSTQEQATSDQREAASGE